MNIEIKQLKSRIESEEFIKLFHGNFNKLLRKMEFKRKIFLSIGMLLFVGTIMIPFFIPLNKISFVFVALLLFSLFVFLLLKNKCFKMERNKLIFSKILSFIGDLKEENILQKQKWKELSSINSLKLIPPLQSILDIEHYILGTFNDVNFKILKVLTKDNTHLISNSIPSMRSMYIKIPYNKKINGSVVIKLAENMEFKEFESEKLEFYNNYAVINNTNYDNDFIITDKFIKYFLQASKKYLFEFSIENNYIHILLVGTIVSNSHIDYSFENIEEYKVIAHNIIEVLNIISTINKGLEKET